MRMRLLGAAAAVSVVLFAGGIAKAAPGPNGHNNKGLCNAYHSGSAKGIANKSEAPPFEALEQMTANGVTVAPDCPGQGSPTL